MKKLASLLTINGLVPTYGYLHYYGAMYMQYLNRKILHGVRFCSLDQLYKKFSRNNVFPSPKLNEGQRQKKVFAENWSGFSPKLGEGLGLFCLIIQRSNHNGGTPKSRWGDANPPWGDASPLVPPTI